jgi:murein L,D-transpeptidase YcbB/YkuD
MDLTCTWERQIPRFFTKISIRMSTNMIAERTSGVRQKYMQIEKEEVPDPLPQVKKPIAAGQQYEATEAGRQELQPTLSVPENSLDYSGAVAEGVKHFQLRHGLVSSGKLGAQTITELNRPMSDRVEQLRLMLERFRWMPHSFAQPPIIANIPEFVLRVYDSSLQPAMIMPVVVGRALRTQTPVLEVEMKYLVFWPYWNVPPSILRGEIVPKITKDPEYLQKSNFEVATYSGEVVTDGGVSEEELAQLCAGQPTTATCTRHHPKPFSARAGAISATAAFELRIPGR